MEQFNLYVHGVPVGHEICGCNEELDYIKGFYNHDVKVEVSSLLQIDIVNGKSFYTYLRKKNVRNAEGRPGSYFGLTVSFPGRYCTNVQMLYEILDAIYKQICVDSLIKSEPGGDRFLVKQISTSLYKDRPAVDYIKAVFKNNLESLRFDGLEGFDNSKVEAKFSLKEVDSPLFHETLKSRRILVSPEYGTVSVSYNSLLKELKPIKDANTQLQLTNTQLTESNNNLAKEVARLEKELADSNASANKKFKKQLEDLQAQLQKCEKERAKLETKIRDATTAVDLIDEPVKKLTRLLAGRFQEQGEEVGKNLSENHPAKRTEHPKTAWIPMGSIILLFAVACLCGYCCYAVSQLPEPIAVIQKNTQHVKQTPDSDQDGGTGTSPKAKEAENNEEPRNESEQPAYDDYSQCYIDVSPYNPTAGDRIQTGTTYTLSVMKKNSRGTAAHVPAGTWVGTPGITIMNNTFTVDNNASKEVFIYYNVSGILEISKKIKTN